MSNSPIPETPLPEEIPDPGSDLAQSPSWPRRVYRWLIGAPRNLRDKTIFHSLTLVAFLAWVGLGADGLSSSSYGPEEAFRALGEHKYLAFALALMMALTVFIISAGYTRIIEEFPHGGGGYVVATKLLGERLGAVSGCALLVDYVLTITVSIAAAGDALFSFLPASLLSLKLPIEFFLIIGLTTVNIRGVRESITMLAPIFLVFVVTHIVVIAGGIISHYPAIAATTQAAQVGFSSGLSTIGIGGMLLLFMHAYSLGGGTYTGIEAVSNGLTLMREPRVQTAKRTMTYMSVSLAITASGLLLLYLLWDIEHVAGKTMNAVLVERLTEGYSWGPSFVVVTLFSEAALLIVAAQAGFLGGPRVLANMAVDSWAPHRFGALSSRLTTMNGITLMGVASLLALWYTHGDVHVLIVMYSINVFLTFALAMLGMAFLWWKRRKIREHWKRRTALFVVAFSLCATILCVTVYEKFLVGGWLTLIVTGVVVLIFFMIRSHYRKVYAVLAKLYADLSHIPMTPHVAIPAFDDNKPTAAVLVASYGGLGIHTVLNIFRNFPGHFHNLVFVSVGVVDSGGFKGEESVSDLQQQTEENLQKYTALATSLGIPSAYRTAVGTDAVEEGAKLCLEVAKEFPHTTFFAGKVIFEEEKWYQRLLHNETAYAIQKRLQWAGRTMVIIPARMRYHKLPAKHETDSKVSV